MASAGNRAEASPLGNPGVLSGAVDELAVIDSVHCRPGWRHHEPRSWRRADGCARGGAAVETGSTRYIWRDGVRVRVGEGSRSSTRTTTRSRTDVNVRGGGRDAGGRQGRSGTDVTPAAAAVNPAARIGCVPAAARKAAVPLGLAAPAAPKAPGRVVVGWTSLRPVPRGSEALAKRPRQQLGPLSVYLRYDVAWSTKLHSVLTRAVASRPLRHQRNTISLHALELFLLFLTPINCPNFFLLAVTAK